MKRNNMKVILNRKNNVNNITAVCFVITYMMYQLLFIHFSIHHLYQNLLKINIS